MYRLYILSDYIFITYLFDLYREWFRQSCLSAKEPSGTLDDPMCKQLLAVLNEPENIQIIASRFYHNTIYNLVYVCVYRILLNVDSNELSLESLPDITTKSNYLRKLLTEKKVGDVLCLKFKLVVWLLYIY